MDYRKELIEWAERYKDAPTNVQYAVMGEKLIELSQRIERRDVEIKRLRERLEGTDK